MKKPWGRPPKVVSPIELKLSDHDKRLVKQLCLVMNVGPSELFHILLAASWEMAKERNDREMEALR